MTTATSDQPQNKTYYGIIPADVRYDERLCANAKLLYCEITALCNDTGFCWAKNSYFSGLYKMNSRSVSRWLTNLKNCGYIDIKDGENQFRKIYIGPARTKLSATTKMSNRLDKNVYPATTKLSTPYIRKNNTINNTIEREARANAFSFLKKNYPMDMEVFEMQNKRQIKDYGKFVEDFNDTCDQEEIKWDRKVLFARLRKYARNWIQNQDKYAAPDQDAKPTYLRNID